MLVIICLIKRKVDSSPHLLLLHLTLKSPNLLFADQPLLKHSHKQTLSMLQTQRTDTLTSIYQWPLYRRHVVAMPWLPDFELSWSILSTARGKFGLEWSLRLTKTKPRAISRRGSLEY